MLVLLRLSLYRLLLVLPLLLSLYRPPCDEEREEEAEEDEEDEEDEEERQEEDEEEVDEERGLE